MTAYDEFANAAGLDDLLPPEPLSAYWRRCKGRPREDYTWVADHIEELEQRIAKLSSGIYRDTDPAALAHRAEFWERRYNEQHGTVHRLENKITELRMKLHAMEEDAEVRGERVEPILQAAVDWARHAKRHGFTGANADIEPVARIFTACRDAGLLED